jgi:N-acetylmuramic acid 6-phosphate etherase
MSFLIAGGRSAMFETAGVQEDDVSAGAIDAAICGPEDVMIAIAASGSTPYTLAAATCAKRNGTFTIAVVNNPGSGLGALADLEIVLDSGPEVIAGSTRMGAGTAQKAALNLLSTLTFIKLGAVHDGMMVSVQASNAKLKRRAAGIVMRIAGASEAGAVAALDAASGNIKVAALLCAGAKDVAVAQRLLQGASGNLRQALVHISEPQ